MGVVTESQKKGVLARRERQLAIPTAPYVQLYSPVRRREILKHLKGTNPSDRSFLSDAARHAGLAPKVLWAWLDHGTNYPKGPLGSFNRAVQKLIAETNDEIRKKIWETGEKSNRWEAFARIGEQFDPGTWKRPSDKQQTTVNVNIIDKLAQVKLAPQDGD